MNTDNTNSHIYINHSNYNECYGRVSIYRYAMQVKKSGAKQVYVDMFLYNVPKAKPV